MLKLICQIWIDIYANSFTSSNLKINDLFKYSDATQNTFD